ncbi:hypothetical protein C6499_10045 [Candidatus Poribacteria bacterium]|nr:MAG: hypothetical protein C6499_10045 [Candidatus Poribacteria bacterium]
MKNFRRPVYIALFLIAATAVWYFGHHRPAQKILKAEPKKVYRTTLPPQNVPPVNSGSPISPAQTSQGTEVEVGAENMHGPSTSALPDEPLHFSTQEVSGGQSGEGSMQQDMPSAEEVAAREAFEKAQSVFDLVQEDVISALKDFQSVQEDFQSALTPPVDSEALKSATEALKSATEGLKSVTEALKDAALQRKTALQNLASYSEEAAKLLAELEAAEARAAESVAKPDDGLDKILNELREEQRILDELLEETR